MWWPTLAGSGTKVWLKTRRVFVVGLRIGNSVAWAARPWPRYAAALGLRVYQMNGDVAAYRDHGPEARATLFISLPPSQLVGELHRRSAGPSGRRSSDRFSPCR